MGNINMSQKLTPKDNPCHDCLQKCCYFSTGTNLEATLSLNEIAKIERATGRSDFYEERNSYYVDELYYRLKSTSDNYCVFYDPQQEICTIYDVRPIDCRLYPFDFDTFDPDKEDMWILNNCLLSQQFDEMTIEKMISDFECNYAKEIAETLNCGESSFVELENSGDFRILREMKIQIPSEK
jgi:Fe-S-cluster containining protein